MYCLNLQKVDDIMIYLKGKYLTSGKMLQSTLYPIKKMLDPRNFEAAIRNSENALRIFKLLEAHEILHLVQTDTLALVETKTIRKLDQELYF